MNTTLSTDAGPIAEPTFDSLSLSESVRRAVDELGYKHPTPVQRAVFETAASGKDIVVQARTGTGKTAAFGLPVIDRLVNPDSKTAQVLILSPTRELALQINRELENLAKYKGVHCTAVYGGASMGPQIDAIRSGTQVIAGTPGRVLDHLERGTLDPRHIRALVLDESDEMLSMGFLPQITRIMEQLPEGHQTLLFSATLPADVKRIAETRLEDPEFITLSGDHIGALSIDHYIYRSAGNKADELVQVLEIENPESAIIFCNTRDQTKRLAAALNRKGFSADWLNADLAQADREKVMRATREGRLRFLVCTDVAARGIDISHLTHVINADFPESTETYVHRTGRTGRAGKTGTAVSLITPQDVGNLYMLRLTYKIFPSERDLPSAGDLQTRKEADLVDFLYKAFAGSSIAPLDLSLARRVITSDVAETIVAGLLRDHLGGHPTSADEAADLRRSKNPPLVRDEPSDEKKPKKKDKQRKKDAKGKVKASDDKDEKSKKRQKPKKTSLEAERDEVASPEEVAPAHTDAARSETAAAAPTNPTSSAPRRSPAPAALSEEVDTAGLEVVSASALLDASELAILEGEDGQTETRAPRRELASRREPSSSKELAARKDPSARKEPESNVGRIFVDAGKLDDVYREDFMEALRQNGFDPKNVVFIKIKDTHSFIGVENSLLREAVAALDGREVAGLEVTAEPARPRRD